MSSKNVSQNVMDFDEETVEKLRVLKDSGPLFIVGCPRSGTTLMLRLIRDYLDFGFGRDDGRFVRFKHLLDRYGDLSHPENFGRLIQDIFADDDFRQRFEGLVLDSEKIRAALERPIYSEIVRHIYATFALMQGKSRWGGKTPCYVFHMDELLDLFPDVKFIHVVRDGRDVALSLFRMPWGAPRNCYIAAKYWKERVDAAQTYGHSLGEERYMEIKYEHLLTDSVSVFQKLLGFVCFEGDHDQVIKRFRERAPTTIRQDNFNKWKTGLSASEIQVFEQIAGDKLQVLGYEVWNEDVIGKPVRPDKAAYYHFHNLFMRAVKESAFGNLLLRLMWVGRSLM